MPFVVKGTGPVQLVRNAIIGLSRVEFVGDATAEAGFVLTGLGIIDPNRVFRPDSKGNPMPAVGH